MMSYITAHHQKESFEHAISAESTDLEDTRLFYISTDLKLRTCSDKKLNIYKMFLTKLTLLPRTQALAIIKNKTYKTNPRMQTEYMLYSLINWCI